ncbi:MAG TPA: hypothetical protein VFY02_03720 [Gaiellaceae bacterium]|nr:hypothetical protein [Gaiellaceae bacterium]
MTSSAPRIDPRLVAALERIDDESLPFAEVSRRVGRVAAELGLPKPSYEQVRVLTRRHRRRELPPDVRALLLDVAFRARPPEALLELLDGAK